MTAGYLLAPNTIDESMAEVLERKRALIDAVTDGRVRDEEKLVDAVVRDLRERPRRRAAADGPACGDLRSPEATSARSAGPPTLSSLRGDSGRPGASQGPCGAER